MATIIMRETVVFNGEMYTAGEEYEVRSPKRFSGYADVKADASKAKGRAAEAAETAEVPEAAETAEVPEAAETAEVPEAADELESDSDIGGD